MDLKKARGRHVAVSRQALKCDDERMRGRWVGATGLVLVILETLHLKNQSSSPNSTCSTSRGPGWVRAFTDILTNYDPSQGKTGPSVLWLVQFLWLELSRVARLESSRVRLWEVSPPRVACAMTLQKWKAQNVGQFLIIFLKKERVLPLFSFGVSLPSEGGR